ncbi:YihY/virulence factor BrkB family protein [Rhodobacteraceae bacterium]|nr:YihY/virulence factor BrkB family protein [Paracoccaceae bacterium]
MTVREKQTTSRDRVVTAIAVAATIWGAVRGPQTRDHGPQTTPTSGDGAAPLRTPSNRAPALSPRALEPRDWWAVLLATKAQIAEDRVLAVAAGVTFYAILALFPALTALVSIFGLFANRERVLGMLEQLGQVVPPEALSLIRGQIESLTSTDQSALGWAMGLGIVLALWSANGGMKALIEALNLAYDQPEGRGFIWLNIFSLGLTIGAIILICALIVAAAVLPPMLDALQVVPGWAVAVLTLRWPLMALVLVVILMVLYHMAPNRKHTRWAWALPGAVVGALMLLASSWGFSFYTANFGNYSATYGSIGAVVVLMMWIWIATISVMLGAEINSEAERRGHKIIARDA